MQPAGQAKCKPTAQRRGASADKTARKCCWVGWTARSVTTKSSVCFSRPTSRLCSSRAERGQAASGDKCRGTMAAAGWPAAHPTEDSSSLAQAVKHDAASDSVLMGTREGRRW